MTTNERDGLAEAWAEAKKSLRHSGLCGVVGGYGFCTCGLERHEKTMDEAVSLATAAVPAEPSEGVIERVTQIIDEYGKGLVPELRIVTSWLTNHFRNDEDARATLGLTGEGYITGGGWRPIETAPKDGTTVMLGVWHHAMGWQTGFGRYDVHETGVAKTEIEGWVSQGIYYGGGYSSGVGLGNPTHWQPLPPPPNSPDNGSISAGEQEQDGEQLARRFHEIYERLAPAFGYETREETRQFDPTTPNGKLMIAVCSEIANTSISPSSNAAERSE